MIFNRPILNTQDWNTFLVAGNAVSKAISMTQVATRRRTEISGRIAVKNLTVEYYLKIEH